MENFVNTPTIKKLPSIIPIFPLNGTIILPKTELPLHIFEERYRKMFLDLRMGAMSMEIVTATKNEDNYLETWAPTHTISQEPCTMKHTIFTASIVGGFGVDQVFNVVADKPFYQYIWIGLMPLKVRTDKLIIKQG